jgi:endonuclease/exonuclease/phosphatase family metal-dependent hydrolase
VSEAARVDDSAGVEVRVLTYNVRSLRDDVDALARLVRAAEPDVVAVQEAPRFARWRSRRAALARRCGLLVATADRTGGLLVMASLRTQPVAASFRALTSAPGHHLRAVTSATVEVAGARLTVASTHLSTDPAERRRHLPELLDALGRLPGPVVLGADLNEEPTVDVARALDADYPDAWTTAGLPAGTGATSPAADPRRRLDAVRVSRGVEVLDARVLDGPDAALASDHLPVLAVLRLPG